MSGPFAFEASTPADAQTNPWRVSAMTSGGRARTTSRASREDHLDAPGIGVAGELARTLGRLDAGEMDDATLDLRDRLLRDDEDVVRARSPCRAAAASTRSAARSSPSSSSGIPRSGITRSSPVKGVP